VDGTEATATAVVASCRKSVVRPLAARPAR